MHDLVGRQAVKDWLTRWEGYIDKDIIARMQYRVIDIPSAQPEIIRCKDCKYTDGCEPIADGRYWCMLHGTFMYYCSDAERRTDE